MLKWLNINVLFYGLENDSAQFSGTGLPENFLSAIRSISDGQKRNIYLIRS